MYMRGGGYNTGPPLSAVGSFEQPSSSTPLIAELDYDPYADAAKAHAPSPQAHKTVLECDSRGRRVGENSFLAWLTAIIPLFLHFVFTISITIFMLLYVDHGKFNITKRMPSIVQVDGSVVHGRHYSPLQSDITTILSIALALTRTVAGSWCGATCWRCAFILMEKTGVSLSELNQMISFGIPSTFMSRQLGRNGVVALVALILIATIPSQFSAPILTGSITWSPSHEYVSGNSPLSGVSVSANGNPWSWYESFIAQRSGTAVQAAGLSSIAWGSTNDATTLKRVLPAARHLPINSTLSNVTLPYFSVSALEWIEDPTNTLTQTQINAINTGDAYLNVSSSDNPLQIVAPNLAIIPSKPWSPNFNGHDYDFPNASTTSDTSVLVLMTSRQDSSNPCSWNTSTFFGNLPKNIGFIPMTFNNHQTNCYVFAHVTYSAGVGTCTNCRLSAPTVVQNDTDITIGADVMTQEALYLMPDVIASMVLMNASVPLQYNNVDNYTVAVLSRSYGAAWTAITNLVGSATETLSTDIKVSVLVSQANVLHWRLYLWLGLNMLLTVSGLLFISIQVGCAKPLVVDCAIAAFLLDNQDVQRKDRRGLSNLSMLAKEDSQIGSLRLRRVKGHMAVVVEDEEEKKHSSRPWT